MEQQYYNEQKKFLIVTDCVIFGFQQDELNVLLVKRDLEPAKGTWSLPTAFVEENESLDSALRRFKRSCAKAGIQQEIRKREHYEKPSVKRKKKSEAARKRKYN